VLGGFWFWIGLAASLFAATTLAVALGRRVRAWRAGNPGTSGLALRSFAAAAILGGAAFLVSVPQFEAPWIGLFACGCLALWGGFLLVEDRFRRAAPRLLRAVDLILFDLAIVLFLMEGSLRVLARVRPSPLLATADAGAEHILAQFRQPAGLLRFGFPTNRGGHYDEEFTEKRPARRSSPASAIRSATARSRTTGTTRRSASGSCRARASTTSAFPEWDRRSTSSCCAPKRCRSIRTPQ
jgi:hypothetical protein